MSKKSSHFDINNSYSYSGYECICSNTLPQVFNDVVVNLPPTTVSSNLTSVVLPSSSNIAVESVSASPIIGIINNQYSSENIVLANNKEYEPAFTKMLTAFGTISQESGVNTSVVPSVQTIPIGTALSQIQSKSLGQEVQQDDAKELKRELITETVTSLTQKKIEDQVGKITDENGIPPEFASQIKSLISSNTAEEIERSLTADPSIINKKEDTANLIAQSISNNFDVQIPQERKDEIIINIVSQVMAETDYINNEMVAAEFITRTPEIKSELNKISDKMTNIMNNSNIQVNDQSGTVTVMPSTQTINQIVNEKNEQLTGKLVETFKQVIEGFEDNNGYTIRLNKMGPLIKAIHTNMANKIERNITQNIAQNKLPEHFTQHPRKYVRDNVSYLNDNLNDINMDSVIRKNLLNTFGNALGKSITEHFSSTNQPNNNVIVSAQVTDKELSNGNKQIAVEAVCDKCNADTKAVAAAIVGTIAKQSNTIPERVTVNNSITDDKKPIVNVITEVPIQTKTESVATSVITAINTTAAPSQASVPAPAQVPAPAPVQVPVPVPAMMQSVVVSNQKNKNSKCNKNYKNNENNENNEKEDSLFNIIIFIIVGFVIYRLFIANK